MKQIYYFKNETSGRTVFVTFSDPTKGDNGNRWTNQLMPVSKKSISNLKQFRYLKGKKVRIGKNEGIITGSHPHHYPLLGKYIGDNFYKSGLLNMNELVCVHWLTGTLPCWIRFDKLELIK